MLIGNKMTKSTLGDLVAAEMNKIVDSEEHINMFSKVAKKKDDKSEDVKYKKDNKSEKSDKPNPFAKKDKKDKKDKEDDKESKKKDKKSEKFEKHEKSDKKDKAKKDKKEDKKDDKKKEMTSESMNSFVNLLTKASDTLDNYGLHKSAVLALQALDTLIGEVAMDKFANLSEDLSEDLPEGVEELEEFADDPEMAKLLDMGKDNGEGFDIDPMFLAELEHLDTGEPTTAFEDLDEADDTSILDELGLSDTETSESNEGYDLGEPLPELAAFVEDNETRKVFSKLDSWMTRHAYEGYGHTDGDLMAAEDDDELSNEGDRQTPDFLAHNTFVPDPDIYKRYDDMLADVNLPREILLDSVPSSKFDWGDDGDDIDEVIHDVNDHRDYGSEDEERAILQKLLTTDPDEDEDELAEGIRTALTTDPDEDENYYADADDEDFEDE